MFEVAIIGGSAARRVFRRCSVPALMILCRRKEDDWQDEQPSEGQGGFMTLQGIAKSGAKTSFGSWFRWGEVLTAAAPGYVENSKAAPQPGAGPQR
jgi:hypothetical protein